MKIVLDIECNALHNPTRIWCIVCKDIDTSSYHIFRDVTKSPEKERFNEFLNRCELVIGHNLLGYDIPVLEALIGAKSRAPGVVEMDTLILSKLIDYPRVKHSVEEYGREFGLPKGEFSDWSKYSPEMEKYCARDVDITEKIYKKYKKYVDNPERRASIILEHEFQLVCNSLEKNGFAFDTAKAQTLLKKVETELSALDKDILTSFPPREVLIREFTPRATKFGTISKTSVPRSLHDKISDFTVGKTYPLVKLVEFNPSSHKQIIQVLNEAGWSPIDKTKTHIDTERSLNKLKRFRIRNNQLDIEMKNLYDKYTELQKVGWKVNEANLETLPSSAPKPAKSLAKRILLESRRRTLTEWLELVSEGRIHGRFYGIGAWTHRMAHQNPNTANIPNELDTFGKKKLYGKELRSFWIAPKNRLLVGCDAEGIQLRIFAHYINDPEFTQALVEGKKDDKTDPHSLNQRILGDACKSRAAAKRFIYALLLGAGLGKLTEILGCDQPETERALDRLLQRYEGWATLKEEVFPKDARRGYFIGLDGRAVRIPGDTESNRRHLAMSGYLQNGEAVVIKKAALYIEPRIKPLGAFFVDIVHDEFQIEAPNDMGICLEIAKIAADAIRIAGEDLKLNCPLAGSYWNDDTKDYTIDRNWSKTH